MVAVAGHCAGLVNLMRMIQDGFCTSMHSKTNA